MHVEHFKCNYNAAMYWTCRHGACTLHVCSSMPLITCMGCGACIHGVPRHLIHEKHTMQRTLVPNADHRYNGMLHSRPGPRQYAIRRSSRMVSILSPNFRLSGSKLPLARFASSSSAAASKRAGNAEYTSAPSTREYIEPIAATVAVPTLFGTRVIKDAEHLLLNTFDHRWCVSRELTAREKKRGQTA